MKVGERIPDGVLERPVSGLNLMPGTLRDQLAEDVNLLVFLRHFGCIFCRETVADMRALTERDGRFPKPLFFFQGSATEGRALLRRDWPSVRAIADPEAEIYEAFGLQRGNLFQMFRPAVWAGRSLAKAKGHENGPHDGDIWRMPGVYLARGAAISWAHHYRHAADHPDYEQISELAASATSGAGG